jgi:DNA invertase Pin-like site-specific DNA recombinase
MGAMIGYARTSGEDQLAGFEEQLARLKAEGCTKIFQEQVSSVAERPAFERALEYVRDGEGDILVITKLDRLARSVRDA